MHTNKRYFRTKSKTKRCKKGGVVINHAVTPENAIMHFFENSTFKYFDRGFFGVTILAMLKKDVVSHYRSARLCSLEPVTQILIKLFKLEKPTAQNIKVITQEDVQREIEIQQDVYHTTFSNNNTMLEPICPCIVYSSTNLEKDAKERLHRLIGKNDNRINDVFSAENLAYIAMEFMDGYVPLQSLEHSPKYNTYKQMSLHMLDKLHTTGYLHSDFNENVLINETYNYYNLNKIGRAIIIDFGESTYVDKINRLKMLKYDANITDSGILDIFDKLDLMHNKVQTIYLEIIETQFNMKIKDIIKMFIFYRGGKMKSVSNKIVQQINKSDKDIPEFQLSKDFITDVEDERELKEINPEAYDKLMNGINYVLQKQQTDHKYIEKLFAAQFSNLIVQDVSSTN